MQALSRVWGVILLFAVVMGGIYGGVFSARPRRPASAPSALSCSPSARRALNRRIFIEVLLESVGTTAMLFTVLIGALLSSPTSST